MGLSAIEGWRWPVERRPMFGVTDEDVDLDLAK
jgi:hypothetical protein